MIQALGDGYELDDAKERIDVEAVHRYLSEEAYWSLGRPLETQVAYVREAARVVGLYHEGAQVGFCRAVHVTGMSFAYLADVYVLDAHRGRGLGIELVREMVEHGPLADCPWILHTRDMHGLYRRFGFGAPGERLMERPAGYAGESRSTRNASESG